MRAIQIRKEKNMALIAVMYAYNLTSSAAKHMLETLSEEKIQECISAYWIHAKRKFDER